MISTATPIRLFCSDLDGTILGSTVPAQRFCECWSERSVGDRPLLIYNSGRTVDNVARLVAARQLPAPEFIIGSIGTELSGGDGALAQAFRARLGRDWDLDAVERIVAGHARVRRQPDALRNEFKSSWYWEHALSGEVESLRMRLQEAGIDALVVYSCRQFLDVVPAQAGKGQALAWLCGRLDIPLADVLVAGDTANDAAMFQLPGIRGIIVGNALPELYREVTDRRVFGARGWMADGVMQGLRHFGVFRELPAKCYSGRSVPVVPCCRA
jgi:sucrose-6F-phosphate phosphohydrolase